VTNIGTIAASTATIITTTTITITVNGATSNRRQRVARLVPRVELPAFYNSSLKSKGLSEKQVIAEKPSAGYDGTWGASVIDPPLFVHLVYISLPTSH